MFATGTAFWLLYLQTADPRRLLPSGVFALLLAALPAATVLALCARKREPRASPWVVVACAGATWPVVVGVVVGLAGCSSGVEGCSFHRGMMMTGGAILGVGAMALPGIVLGLLAHGGYEAWLASRRSKR